MEDSLSIVVKTTNSQSVLLLRIYFNSPHRYFYIEGKIIADLPLNFFI